MTAKVAAIVRGTIVRLEDRLRSIREVLIDDVGDLPAYLEELAHDVQQFSWRVKEELARIENMLVEFENDLEDAGFSLDGHGDPEYGLLAISSDQFLAEFGEAPAPRPEYQVPGSNGGEVESERWSAGLAKLGDALMELREIALDEETQDRLARVWDPALTFEEWLRGNEEPEPDSYPGDPEVELYRIIEGVGVIG